MRTLMGDVRYGLRALVRNPGYAMVALVTLALGIGANTAIFSVVRTVLLRPLPFEEPDRLVAVWETRLDRGWTSASFTHANFWDVRDRNRSLEAVAALGWERRNLTGLDQPERVGVAAVSADFFRVLGVSPVAGRAFARGEDEADADTRIAILAHAFWSTRFGADREVVGRQLVLDGIAHTVIGVLPAGGSWLQSADLFVPMIRRPDANRGSFELAVIGRLAGGFTIETARADLERVANDLAAEYPETNAGMGIAMESSARWVAGDSLRRALWILMGSVGLLLLIACVNLANLLLARATGRAREAAVRAALGASRGRLVVLVMTESLLLGFLGAGVGLALAASIVSLLRRFNPGGIPRLDEVAIDGTVLGFTILVAVITSALTGLIPALRPSNRSVVAELRESERSVGSRRLNRFRSVLVGGEVALSLMLLIGAGLLIRSFTRVLNIERGFDTGNRLVFEVSLPASYGEPPGRAAQLLDEYLARIQSHAQVVSAAAVSMRPLRGVGTGMGFAAGDRPPPAGDAVPWASWRIVTPGYFRTMGIPLIAGRDFSPADAPRPPWRVVISQRIAEHLWPGEDAVGRTLILWQGQGAIPAEIIGVAADTRDWDLAGGPSFAVYLSMGNGFSPDFVVQASVPPMSLLPMLRSTLAELDPQLPISGIMTMDDLVGASVASRQFTMLLLAALAGVALLLALAGVYGVLSYSVTRRRAEIGMRLAVGASPERVLGLVLVQGMRPVVFGVLAGLAGAFALMRLMSNLLFEVQAVDPVTYAAVAVLLLGAAAFSCWVPARNAMRLDVVAALREE